MPRAALWKALFASDESFVTFHGATARAKRYSKITRAHGLTNAMRREPRRLDRTAQRARKLVAGNPFLARAKQKRCLKPLMQLQVSGLENRTLRATELFSAVVAFPKPKPNTALFVLYTF